MKVVIDARVTQDYKGGSTTYIVKLINTLTRIDKKSDYFYCTHKESCLFEQADWWKASAPLNNHIVGDPWEQFLLPLQLSHKSVDIYHAATERLPMLKFGTKYVLTVHDLCALTVPEFVGSRRFVAYTRAQLVHAIRRADNIIAVSQHTKKDLVELLKVDEKRIRVILEGADRRYRALNSSVCFETLKKNHSITEGYILAIGAFNPRKNLRRLFEAYRMLRSEGIDKTLVVVGFRHWRYQEILDGVKENILFLENVTEEELPCLYNCADLFVYPSLYEGFGLPLLEAMACGTPIAASNSSSIPEVTGDAALLFDPRNVQDISGKMHDILRDSGLQRKLRNRGLARSKLFSWEKAAQETLDVYRSTLQGT